MDTDDTTSWGIGMFPLGALFNHSCYPNCIYYSDVHPEPLALESASSNAVTNNTNSTAAATATAAAPSSTDSIGPHLQFRLVRPVHPGEQLCVTYTGLYEHRRNRRSDLLRSKHFLCICPKCVLRPCSQEVCAVVVIPLVSLFTSNMLCAWNVGIDKICS